MFGRSSLGVRALSRLVAVAIVATCLTVVSASPVSAAAVGGTETPVWYRDLVDEDDPIGYWPLDEDNATTRPASAADLSGNGRDGSVGAAVTAVKGGPLGAEQRVYDFSSSTACGVDLHAYADAFKLSTFTFEAWVRTTSTAEAYVTRARYFGNGLITNGHAAFGGWETGPASRGLAGSSTVSDGEWHHLVGTRNSTQWQLWVDGRREATLPATGSVYYYGSEFSIGRDGTACSNDRFIGQISNVAIYDKVLPDRRIAKHAGMPHGPHARTAEEMLGALRSTGSASDPVNTATGNFYDSWTDLRGSSGVYGLEVTRGYNALDPTVGVFGPGWSTPYSQTAIDETDGSVGVRLADGRHAYFEPDGVGGWERPFELNADLAVEVDGSYRLEFPDEAWQFDLDGRIEEMVRWDGVSATITRGVDGEVVDVVSSLGPRLDFSYTVTGRLESVTAVDVVGPPPVGRAVTYGYDYTNTAFPDGLLVSVTDPAGKVTEFVPDAAGRVDQMIDGTGVVLVDNTFDLWGRVEAQATPTGTVEFTYHDDLSTDVTLVSVTPNETVTYLHDEYGRLIGMKDPFGGVPATERTYDPTTGWLETSTDRVSQEVEATYDANGNPESFADPKSGVTTTDYDAQSRLIEAVSPVSGTTTYAYDDPLVSGDEDSRIPYLVTDELGNETHNVVLDGLIESTTDADGVTVEFGYDALRRLETITDELNRTTTFGYDTAGRQNSVETPEGRLTETLFRADGLVDVATAADLGETSYSYDDAGRVLTVTDPTTAVTRNTYDPDTGLLATVERPGDTLGTFGPPSVYHYDSVGQLERITDPTGVEVVTNFDTFGRVASTEDTAGRETSYTYDDNGRVKTVTAPDAAAPSEIERNAKDQVEDLTDPLDRKVHYEYQSNGLVESVTAGFGTPDAATTTYHYDGLGRRWKTTDPMNRETETHFTDAGRVDHTIDTANEQTTLFYDTAGQLERIEDAAGGDRLFSYWDDGMVHTDTSPEGRETAYTYDLGGRVETITDPAGVVTTKTWSQRGELLFDALTGRGTIGYTYYSHGAMKTATDRLGNTTGYGYDAAGRLTARITPMGTETWDYNPTTGELETFTPVAVTGAPSGAVTYGYNADTGRLETVTDGSGRTRTTTFDDAGQVDTITYNDGVTSMVHDYGYDDLGRTETITAPDGTYTNAYNLAGQLTAAITPGGRTTSYGYDTAGRRASMTMPDGTTLLYQDYDALSRVGTLRPEASVADSFTAVDNTALNGGKWATNNGKVIANRMDLNVATAGGTYARSLSRLRTSRDVTFTYAVADVSAGGSGGFSIQVRANSGGETIAVEIPTTSTTASVRSYNPTATTLGTFTTPALSAGADRKLRFVSTPTALKVWVWDPAAGPQPSTPSWEQTTPATPVDQQTTLRAVRLSGSTANAVSIDDYTDIDPTNGETALATFTYNDDSQLTAETFIGGSRTHSYDATTGQLTGMVQTIGAATITYSLGYDGSGAINTENRTSSTGSSPTTYTYDQAGQLTTFTRSPNATVTYGYDRGRLTSKKIGAGTPTTYTYNDRSQLTTITPPTGTATSIDYDGAGRRTLETTGTNTVAYSYDPAGRHTGTARTTSGVTTTETRTLDPSGLITNVAVGAANTRIDWDTNQAVAQMTTWTSPAVTNLIRGPGGWTGTRNGTTTTATAQDIHRSATLYASGGQLDPHGNGISAGGTYLGYRGELTINGTTNLRNRDYHATTAQFTTTDPLPDVPGTPTNGNPYHYTNNNPLNLVDPLGLRPADEIFEDMLHGWEWTQSQAECMAEMLPDQFGITEMRYSAALDTCRRQAAPRLKHDRSDDYCPYGGQALCVMAVFRAHGMPKANEKFVMEYYCNGPGDNYTSRGCDPGGVRRDHVAEYFVIDLPIALLTSGVGSLVAKAFAKQGVTTGAAALADDLGGVAADAGPATAAARAGALRPGAAPQPNATVRDLRGLLPGNNAEAIKLSQLEGLSDARLLQAVNNPADGAFMGVYSGGNVLANGNHRALVLLQRAESASSSITWDTPIYIRGFG